MAHLTPQNVRLLELEDAVQEQIKRAWQASPDTLQCGKVSTPAGVFTLVRPEGTYVRFELRQKPALIAILHGLDELGWPTHLGDSALARSGL